MLSSELLHTDYRCGSATLCHGVATKLRGAQPAVEGVRAPGDDTTSSVQLGVEAQQLDRSLGEQGRVTTRLARPWTRVSLVARGASQARANNAADWSGARHQFPVRNRFSQATKR